MLPFPPPAHRTGRADLPHPALGPEFFLRSPTGRCADAGAGISDQEKWCQFIFLFLNQPNLIGDGGDQYKGLDRFGRVVDQYWVQAGQALK